MAWATILGAGTTPDMAGSADPGMRRMPGLS